MGMARQQGQDRFSQALGSHPDQWDVFYNVPVGDDLVDAVLMGPRGLFGVTAADTESKVSIQGRALYSGQERHAHLVRKTWVRAHRLGTRLGKAVDPVLCLTSEDDLIGYVGTLVIVSPDRMPDYFTRASGNLSVAALSELRERIGQVA